MNKYEKLKTELESLRQLDATTAKAYNSNLLELGDIKAERDRLKAVNAEMLEALKFALDMLNHLPDRIGGIGTKYVKERMNAAIAKAEGQ